MRILIVGADGRGSFEVRGRQLGQALGARVTTTPSRDDWAWAEVIVLVKHAGIVWGPHARLLTKAPIVWDVLDVWRQPEENQVPVKDLKRRILEVRDVIGATTLIGATEAMAEDLDGVYLPHHSRPGLVPTPPREHASVVAYEGTKKYLGGWARALGQSCADRGLTFVINPPDLSQADIIVAFRDGPWDGEVCRRWKSGVKVVNAIAAGRPILMQDCAAWHELPTYWCPVEDRGHGLSLDFLLDHWSKLVHREAPYRAALEDAPKYTLDAIATRYREILATTARAVV